MTDIHEKCSHVGSTNNVKIGESNQDLSGQPLSQDEIRLSQFVEDFSFCALAWLGTVFSGALYAASESLLALQMEDAGVAFMVASILIGVCSAPVIITVTIVTRASGLIRFRLYAASLAGGFSCAIAAVIYAENTNSYLSDVWKLIALEGLFGAIGSPLVVYLFGRRRFSHHNRNQATQTLLQFTMNDGNLHHNRCQATELTNPQAQEVVDETHIPPAAAPPR
jgi:hypothetical protein